MAARLPERPPVLAGLSHIRALGRGGFADVFLFEQNMPRRSVAVKVLHRGVVDEDVRRMFNSEADVMARLGSHPSIVTVYDASISADGRPYLVMELCPGSMGARYRTEAIPVAEVLHTGVKIASALETAVREGILHRDIKPSNILTTTFGAPVLADFGIATALASSKHEDVVAMSVPWSAPEIVEERTNGTVASEVWAFGATLYTLLAGRTPFEVEGTGKNTRDELIKRISRAHYTPTGRIDVPPRLEAVLQRTLERDPARRPASLLEVASELQYVQYDLGIMPTPLEIAAGGWTDAAGAGSLDFDDRGTRGPTISTVPLESRRVKPATIATQAPTDDDFFAHQAPVRRRRNGLIAVLVVAGVVVVLGIAAIVASVIVGGL